MALDVYRLLPEELNRVRAALLGWTYRVLRFRAMPRATRGHQVTNLEPHFE